jgi:hypothetical protein
MNSYKRKLEECVNRVKPEAAYFFEVYMMSGNQLILPLIINPNEKDRDRSFKIKT